jgi:hypothetical protein
MYVVFQAVPSAARFPKEAPEPKTKASKGSSGLKVQAKNEPREDDVWIGLHNKYTYDIETKAKGSVRHLLYAFMVQPETGGRASD